MAEPASKIIPLREKLPEDPPYDYRREWIIGRLAILDEIAERRWEKMYTRAVAEELTEHRR